ncbi:hypothetical protein SARC_12580, partial [Sphaeroforma arctica JP610]
MLGSRTNAHTRQIKSRLDFMQLERDTGSGHVDGAAVLIVLMEDVLPKLQKWLNANLRMQRSKYPTSVRLLQVHEWEFVAFIAAFGLLGLTHEADHTPKRDCVQYIREYENELFGKSLKIFFIEYAWLTLDDEQCGSRAKDIPKKSKVDRKAKTWGFKADMVADAVYSTIIGVRYHERGYNQNSAVKDLFERINCTYTESRHKGMAKVTADRGYGNEQLWNSLADRGLGSMLILISNRYTGHPWVGASSKGAHMYPAQFVVPDEPCLGDRIFAASKLIKTSVGAAVKEMNAFAYGIRQMPRKRGNHDTPTDVLRFISIGDGDASDLKGVYVCVRRPNPKDEIVDVTLFWLNTNRVRSEHILRMEDTLRQVVNVETCAQRSNEWFKCRYFKITGTAGHMRTIRDTSCRKFLLKPRGVNTSVNPIVALPTPDDTIPSLYTPAEFNKTQASAQSYISSDGHGRTVECEPNVNDSTGDIETIKGSVVVAILTPVGKMKLPP